MGCLSFTAVARHWQQAVMLNVPNPHHPANVLQQQVCSKLRHVTFKRKEEGLQGEGGGRRRKVEWGRKELETIDCLTIPHTHT